MSNDLSARISRAQLDIDTAALRQRIAELEADNQALGASISQAGYDSYEQSIRNRELREKAEAAEKITRELSAENAGLRRQLYDANAELERLRAERWEPYARVDIVGFGTNLHLSGNMLTLYDSKWGNGPLGDPHAYTFELTPDLALCRKEARHDS